MGFESSSLFVYDLNGDVTSHKGKKAGFQSSWNFLFCGLRGIDPTNCQVPNIPIAISSLVDIKVYYNVTIFVTS